MKIEEIIYLSFTRLEKPAIDQAISLIKQLLKGKMPKEKLKEDYHPLDPENEYYEGYNQALQDVIKIIEEA